MQEYYEFESFRSVWIRSGEAAIEGGERPAREYHFNYDSLIEISRAVSSLFCTIALFKSLGFFLWIFVKRSHF